MANVLLTQRCVRSCPYCFARRHMAEAPPDDVMSWEDLIYVADFLRADGQRRFALLGGEPTLHPEFVDMVLYLLARGFEVTVFTSGVLQDRTLEQAATAFRSIPQDRLSFVCNLNDPAQTPAPPAEIEAVRRFLRTFGERVAPGFNIYRTDFDLGFLFQYISEYALKRTIRLGLAHPIVGTRNRFIRIDEIDLVIARLFSYAEDFEQLRVRPGLDCGFPMCRFSDDQLGWLYRQTGGRFSFGCSPVIDIGPDLAVWSCFPLSAFHRRSLLEFDALPKCHEYYAELHRKVRTEVAGLYAQCDGCRAREDGHCHGGCVAHNLGRFQEEAPLRMRELYL